MLRVPPKQQCADNQQSNAKSYNGEFFHSAMMPNDPKLSHADGRVAPQGLLSLYNSNRP